MSARERPKKWAWHNRSLDEKKLEHEELVINAGLVGWKLLADTFAYKCGYRPVQWAGEERSQKTRKNVTRFQEVMGKQKNILEEAGITGDHINIMLSTARRYMDFETAHQMTLVLLACKLKMLSRLQIMPDDARDAMTRVFQSVSGYSIDKVIEAKGKMNLVLAVDGLKAEDFMFARAPLATLANW